MTKVSIIFLFLAFIFGSETNSVAQNNSCNLQLKLWEYGNDDKASLAVQDAKISLKNIKTKEKQNLITSSSLFENLQAGKYRIDVSKNGFKNRAKEFEVDCDYADKNNVFSAYIYLWNDGSNTIRTYSQQKETVENKTELEKETKNDNSSVTHSVTLKILVDEDGNVVSAKAIKGESDYIAASVKAARQSKFSPTKQGGEPVKVTGIIVYNFTP